jgi:hypothetical protein
MLGAESSDLSLTEFWKLRLSFDSNSMSEAKAGTQGVRNVALDPLFLRISIY